MTVTKRVKASEKQTICRRIVSTLKSRYKGTPPKNERPVLETMLYAICLEDASFEQADAAYERYFSDFFDLNEVRVSSISELEPIFEGMPQPEWKALRARTLLNEIFERHYAFEFEILRRKTLDQAQKELEKIRYLSPFVKLYTLQTIVGAHVVPIDETLLSAAIWLGLVEPGASVEEGATQLKPALRKADVAAFCYYLRHLATDPVVHRAFDFKKKPPPEEGFDVLSAPQRLEELFAHYDQLARKRRATKKVTKKKGAAAAATKKKATRAAATKRRKK